MKGSSCYLLGPEPEFRSCLPLLLIINIKEMENKLNRKVVKTIFHRLDSILGLILHPPLFSYFTQSSLPSLIAASDQRPSRPLVGSK